METRPENLPSKKLSPASILTLKLILVLLALNLVGLPSLSWIFSFLIRQNYGYSGYGETCSVTAAILVIFEAQIIAFVLVFANAAWFLRLPFVTLLIAIANLTIASGLAIESGDQLPATSTRPMEIMIQVTALSAITIRLAAR